MDFFEIQGGKKLKGKIEVRGSKNATTPILAATLLTKDRCIISNLPLIEDVFRMIEILKSMGSEIKWLGERKISITNKKINPEKIDTETVKKLRSSVLLLGPLSARFKKFKFYRPGGCVIGARPLGTHFEALRKMGVDIKQTEKYYFADIKKRNGGKIVLEGMSVTATENIMMLAVSIPTQTIIKIAACEPHVEDLGRFLIKMGAKIRGLGTHTLEIQGTKNLHGAKHEIIPDANEAATFLIMGVATGSSIEVKNAVEDHLDLVLERLRQFGADFVINKNSIKVIPAKKLKAIAKLDTRTYPGIPSDVQAPFGILATQAVGKTLMHDTLFDRRFNYISEIKKMGAKAKVVDAHQVLIEGPVKLKGKVIKSYDLRAGASLIIAALLAKDKTIIEDIYQVDRGYEKIEERLQKLGADIKRIKK